MKATNLREICSLSQTRKNIFDYYRTSKIVQNGSGDESITIVQPPRTEGIKVQNIYTIYSLSDLYLNHSLI